MPAKPVLGDGRYGFIKVLGDTPNADTQVIYFPTMPPEIVLARESSFDVSSNMVFPDGLHFYNHTNPLEIPLSWSLHYSDDYCKEGSQSLLDLGARLHALTLPATRPTFGTSALPAQPNSNGSGVSNQSNLTSASQQRTNQANQASDTSDTATLTYPPACLLSIVLSSADGYGVNCYGYVKSVKVTMKGPWLQVEGANNVGNSIAGAKNLPTSCDYEFTFVHSPGYSNRLGQFDFQAQAYGPDIYNSLFNTQKLSGSTANTEISSLGSSMLQPVANFSQSTNIGLRSS